MRNLLLITTLAIMLISQALAPRLVFAMPVEQHAVTQIDAHDNHKVMNCCQGKMDCKHCNTTNDDCSQLGNCASHCSNVVSAIAVITSLQPQPTLTQEISCPTWSLQTALIGVQTPPPNVL